MAVEALDHVNIMTDRLDETANFYAEVLGLERRDSPSGNRSDVSQWMHDETGRAIIHLNAAECPRPFDRAFERGVPTGAVHHVALRVTGFARVSQALEERGAPFQVNHIKAANLRQIFVTDPNQVLLELNFFEA